MDAQTQFLVSAASLVIALILFLAVIRISISTNRTARALERTNELLETIASRKP